MMSVQLLWSRRVGLDFVRGVGADAAVRWSKLRRCCGDGAAVIDEAIIRAAPWKWRMGQLNWRDNEMDDGSSSGEVDEGRRAVAVDDVVGEEAPAGQR